MLTIMEMMSHPVFHEFRLITDQSGLSNSIRNAAFLEYETDSLLEKDFFPGDFVVTSLISCRENKALAAHTIMTLIKKRISALAIRDTFFTTIPDEVIEFANNEHIPIFMFSHANTAELLFVLKNRLSFHEINSQTTRRMREIIYKNVSEEEADILARDINPFFTNNLICAFGIPYDYQNKEKIISQLSAKYRDSLTSTKTDPEASYSILFFSVGICLIYSDQRSSRDLRKDIDDLMMQFDVQFEDFAIGFSEQMTKLSDIGLATKQAIYASTDAHLNRSGTQDYHRMGITRVLCPLRNDYWMKSYYDDLLMRITNYDEKHESHLFETISDFVHCDGVINKVADISYQHPNTIRYRIKKTQEILGIENAMDFRIQLFTLIRLYEINKLLLDWRL